MRTLTKTFALALLLVLAACSKDATGPSNNSPMSATVDGATWSALGTPGSVMVTRAGQNLIIAGADGQGRSISLSLYNITEPGTYTMNSVVFGMYFENVGQKSWLSTLPGASGSITVKTLSENRISGTFQFAARAVNQESPVTRQVTNGRFDVTF